MAEPTPIPKPPLGLTPRTIHEEIRRDSERYHAMAWDNARLEEIDQAILRYNAAAMDIPAEWQDERNEILLRIKKREA